MKNNHRRRGFTEGLKELLAPPYNLFIPLSLSRNPPLCSPTIRILLQWDYDLLETSLTTVEAGLAAAHRIESRGTPPRRLSLYLRLLFLVSSHNFSPDHRRESLKRRQGNVERGSTLPQLTTFFHLDVINNRFIN
ncbi:hypothetical protein PUN28_018791 [Cardiocondyla obscurior]|uniref:Uncharacterized protein n=1 Tax=Cardiocondyla obscurior TaxID=286306 RepID=A0AAW2ECS7_9HYME